MTSLRLIIDEPAEGAWNMAVDEALLLSAAAGGPGTLRFYGWSKPTLSLGYFQGLSERDSHAASRHCPLVRRASGGGAIVHDHELTYSFSTRFGGPWKRDQTQLYRLFHETLIEGLCDLAPQERPVRYGSAWDANGSSTPPADELIAELDSANSADDMAATRLSEPFLCFQRRSAEDVVLASSKIAGSAQRRHAGAVVQHGSVLLGRSACAPELPGWNDISGELLNFDQLCQAWLVRLRQSLGSFAGAEIVVGSMTDDERTDAHRIAQDKYRHPHWTGQK